MKMNILGTEYTFKKNTKQLEKEGFDGLCRIYNRSITVRDVSDMLEDTDDLNAKKKRYDETCRHEVIHAFFGEVGLNEYCDDEILVNFLAVVFPKMVKIFDENGWLERGDVNADS